MADETPTPVLSDDEFRALLDLLMVSDPWPIDTDTGQHLLLQDLAAREWAARGHDDNSWLVAYHEHQQEETRI